MNLIKHENSVIFYIYHRRLCELTKTNLNLMDAFWYYVECGLIFEWRQLSSYWRLKAKIDQQLASSEMSKIFQDHNFARLYPFGL